jgi:hypothetical protein
MPNIKGRKPKFGFFEDGSNVDTYGYKIPNCAIDAINTLLLKQQHILAKSKGQTLTLRQLLKGLVKAELPGNAISFSKDDIESMNLRALGFIAYKLGIQDRPLEPKKADQQDIIDQICAKLELT